MLELSIETMKIESGACDLPPKGSKKNELEAGNRGLEIFGRYLEDIWIVIHGCMMDDP